jgi:DNA-binding transcriptional regulator YiaG
MGVVTPASLERRAATSNSPIQYEKREANAAPAAVSIEPTPAENLARVREVLKPAVLELANLFGVSRQAVYAWQDGAQPSPIAAARLAMLARASDVFANAGLAVDTKTLRRRVAGGGTVLDAVLKGGDAVQVAKSLLQTLSREAGQRQRLNKQLSGRQRPAPGVDEYASPAPAEDG